VEAVVPNRSLVVLLTLIAVALLFTPARPSKAQNGGQGGRGAAAAPSQPAPRGANGRTLLGPRPGEKGVWQGDGRLAINPNSYEPNSTRNALIHINDIPLQSWARAIVGDRHAAFLKYEPHARCKASGGPREFVTPYGFEIVEMPELQVVYIFDIGGPHSFRTIYMDGRKHPTSLNPSFYGHSIGHWEGDTLVIDVVGFNEKFWMNRDGLPHTDQMHLMEKFTRVDFNTLKYEVTVDDPGAYTAPWTSGFNLRWTDGQELFEYVCQDNNHFPDSVFDAADSADRNRP
jgi:hypothetical protein